MLETQIGKLGDRLDGWADLVDSMAGQVEQVHDHFREIMNERQMPAVDVERRNMTTGGLGSKQRLYHICYHQAGATMAVYIGAVGRDLYVAWDAFLKPIWNQAVIWGILGVSAFLAVLGSTSTNQFSGETSFKFGTWIVETIVLTVFLSLLVAGAGRILRGNPMAFFIKQIDEFTADDITAMMIAVHHSLLQALDTVGIDRTILRMKEQFRAGQRERLI